MSEAAKTEPPWWPAAKANPFFWKGLAGAAVIAAIDQISKLWIVHIVKLPQRQHIEISALFDLSYVENKGASFGMFAGGLGSRILLSLISTGVALGLARWLGRLHRPIAVVGVALIIGGALGNLVDRVAYGHVVDFLDFSAVPFPNIELKRDFPFIDRIFIGGFIWVFNIADAAINIGIACLLLDAFQTSRAERAMKNASLRMPQRSAITNPAGRGDDDKVE